MKYSLYQQARDLSWKVIQEKGIQCLPVNLGEICRHYQIKTIPYSKFTLWELVDTQAKKGDGFSLKMGEQYYIVFNHAISHSGRIRFTIAHEIGHILLGHVEKVTFYRNSEIDSDTNEQEFQANVFARDLLMPATVLSALGLESAEEISALCGVSMQSAKIRALRLTELNLRNRFHLHPLERAVAAQFANYIQSMKSKK